MPEQTLMMMDELYGYGKGMEGLTGAYAAARKFGVQLWGCLQDLEQLKSMFPGMHDSFMNNCGVVQWLEATDPEGSLYLSNRCGEREVLAFQKSLGFDHSRFGKIRPGLGVDPKKMKITGTPSWRDLEKLHVTQSFSQQKRKLMLPQEVQLLGPNEQIVILKGLPPLFCNRKPYYATHLASRARPNPYYRGKKDVQVDFLTKLLGGK